MIIDRQTDTVFFSRHLKRYKCWKSIKTALIENNIPFALLLETADIWVRDFMPIQIDRETFVSYIYNPDYLQDRQEYITSDVSKCYDFTKLTDIELVIDGGNFIKCDNKVIMTDKVFLENSEKSAKEIRETIERCFESELVVIPWDKAEKYGHADGMVRYVGTGHVVINNYADFDKLLRDEIIDALTPHFTRISELQYGKNNRSKSWAHINFLHTGSYIFVPQMGIPSDTLAIEQLKEIFSDCTIVPVEANGIVNKGGALNCVSWNIKAL